MYLRTEDALVGVDCGPRWCGDGLVFKDEVVFVLGNSPLAKGLDGDCEPQPFLCCVEVANSKSACLEIDVKSCLCSKRIGAFAWYLDLQLFLKN